MPQDNRIFNKHGSAKFGWIGAAALILLIVAALWWNHYELPRRQKQQAAKVEQPTAPAPAQMAASQPQAVVVPQTPPPKQESAQAPVAKEEKKAEASIPKQKQNDAQATTAKQKEARATTVRRQDVINTSTSRNAMPAFYYASQDSCEAAVRAGKAVGYQPTARHVKYGDVRVTGYDRRPLEGDACVLLGAQPGRRWVFLPQGTMVYTSGPEVKFLAECQNDIFDVAYIRKEVAPPPVQPTVPVAVIEEKKVLKVVPYCELPDGTQVKALIQNGEAVCPELKFRAPVTVDQPVRIQPHVTATPVVPVPPPQAAPQQKAEVPCVECRAEAKVLGEEPSLHGICGIRAVDQAGRTVGLIQIDNNRGMVRYALVPQWGARPVLVKNTTEPSSPQRNCNVDQSTIERHWAHVIESLRLPLECRPQRAHSQQPQLQMPNIPQQRYAADRKSVV